MPFLESARRSEEFAGEGPAFTEATLYEIRAAARAAANDSRERRFLLAEGESPDDIMGRIFSTVQRRIIFSPDPTNTEDVQAPLMTIRRGEGDCDDTSALVAAALLANGIQARIVGIKKNAASKHFDHVYAMGYNPFLDLWIPLDTQYRYSEPPPAAAKMEISA
jgi:transglutaminase-like putative cysteine protease